MRESESGAEHGNAAGTHGGPDDEHDGEGSGQTLTTSAIAATVHCLTGCAIGEVLGMVIGRAVGFSNAVKIALAADTVSIAAMEVIDNAFMLVVPGAMDAGLTSWLFWGSLAVALALAFVVTVPVNRWLIGRGSGHAVMHQFRK